MVGLHSWSVITRHWLWAMDHIQVHQCDRCGSRREAVAPGGWLEPTKDRAEGCLIFDPKGGE